MEGVVLGWKGQLSFMMVGGVAVRGEGGGGERGRQASENGFRI